MNDRPSPFGLYEACGIADVQHKVGPKHMHAKSAMDTFQYPKHQMSQRDIPWRGQLSNYLPDSEHVRLKECRILLVSVPVDVHLTAENAE